MSTQREGPANEEPCFDLLPRCRNCLDGVWGVDDLCAVVLGDLWRKLFLHHLHREPILLFYRPVQHELRTMPLWHLSVPQLYRGLLREWGVAL